MQRISIPLCGIEIDDLCRCVDEDFEAFFNQMIERFPEVQRLTNMQKLELATELWNELSSESDALEPNPGIVQLLEQRYADYKTGLQPSSPWDEVKRRIGKL